MEINDRSFFKFGAFLHGKSLFSRPNSISYNENTISFAELVDSKNIIKAFLSSYCIDIDWIISKFNCPISLLINPPKNERNEKGKSYFLTPKIRITYPPFYKNAFGVFHAKIMILWFEKGLRIVISSANMIDYDYGEVQNIMFVQDLNYTLEDNSNSSFYKDISFFLLSCSVSKDVLNALKDYSWNNINANIVFSIPGNSASGIKMLHNQLKKFPKFEVVECLGSSIGCMTEKWIENFWENVKIIFPTEKQALTNKNAYGTIFCKKVTWKNCPLKESFFNAISVLDTKQALHAKVMVFLNTSDVVIAYLGSHNFTPSAWGKYTKSGRIFIANYELGVLFSPRTIPFQCPYKRPAEKYTSLDLPWCQS